MTLISPDEEVSETLTWCSMGIWEDYGMKILLPIWMGKLGFISSPIWKGKLRFISFLIWKEKLRFVSAPICKWEFRFILSFTREVKLGWTKENPEIFGMNSHHQTQDWLCLRRRSQILNRKRAPKEQQLESFHLWVTPLEVIIPSNLSPFLFTDRWAIGWYGWISFV